jgi:hypothetical protein
VSGVERTNSRRLVVAGLHLLFFLSGVPGLVAQLAWT